jgi:hypothetical protein
LNNSGKQIVTVANVFVRDWKIITKRLFTSFVYLKERFADACQGILKDNNSGIAAMEASLTLPVILMLIFFMFELLKVNNTRTALDSMALEATLDFVVNKSTTNFPAIVKKYSPVYIQEGDIKYYFAVYSDLNTMCKDSPFGSEEVFWLENTDVAMPTTPTAYLDSDKSGTFLKRTGDKTGTTNITTPGLQPAGLIGNAFVLTFVCKFVFSSDFVKKLFAGGTNTAGTKHFLIWGRGVGICN